MNTHLFAPFTEVIGGLIVGILFGFILNKAAVTRFSTIVGQLMLKDFTVMKVIMTAIATGSFGLYLLKGFSFPVELSISKTTLFAALLGGSIFGVGMAVLGLCPGTCVGALSSKAKDAWFGILGMVIGAALYAEIFPWVKATIKPDSAISKITLPEFFGISPWFFIGGVLMFVLGFLFLDKRQKKLYPSIEG
jgi:uncharacterized protein